MTLPNRDALVNTDRNSSLDTCVPYLPSPDPIVHVINPQSGERSVSFSPASSAYEDKSPRSLSSSLHVVDDMAIPVVQSHVIGGLPEPS